MYVTIARVAKQQTYVRIVEAVVSVDFQLALLHECVQLLKTSNHNVHVHNNVVIHQRRHYRIQKHYCGLKYEDVVPQER